MNETKAVSPSTTPAGPETQAEWESVYGTSCRYPRPCVCWYCMADVRDGSTTITVK